ncbi:MAG: 4Fe-4S dicluster domain-containing protein [Planctomycetota bacterium]|jgi:ferredoxin
MSDRKAGPGDPAPQHDPDAGRVERAIGAAARTVERFLAEGLYGHPKVAVRPASQAPLGAIRGSPDRNSRIVKDAAKRFGADLAGICRVDRNWLYARGEQLPQDLPHAVVMAVAMDVEGIRRSPAPAARAATFMGYRDIAICAACLGIFVRELGYKAMAAGNEAASSVPLAVEAGLGRQGRHGLLITPQYGSCVRLCKVFTDMPLEVDYPAEPILERYCDNCDLCAKACPAGAIDFSAEPAKGRWIADGQKCGEMFYKGTDYGCATCVAVCPFTTEKRTNDSAP